MALASLFLPDKRFRLLTLFATLVALALLPAAVARAIAVTNTYNVNTTADESDQTCASSCTSGTAAGPDGLLSLREAIQAGNNDGGPSVINVPAGTYAIKLLGSPLPTLGSNGDWTINGSGARGTIVDLSSIHGGPVFSVDNGVTTSISGLTATGGSLSGGGDGGGIALQNGALNLDSVTVSGNDADDGGGGIWVRSTAMLTMTNSTVSGNSASPHSNQTGNPDGGTGGGILNEGGTLDIKNSTISGNQARKSSGSPGTGGTGGGIWNNGTINLTFVTLADNFADQDGGDIYGTGTTNVLNVLLATGHPHNCASNVTLVPGAGDQTFSDDGSCTGATHANASIPLGALANNGGPTDTQMLLVGNQAIDATDCAGYTTDQRGVSRPQGPTCDSGALEVIPGENVPPPGGAGTTTGAGGAGTTTTVGGLTVVGAPAHGVLSALSLSPRRFRAFDSGPSVRAASPRGSIVSYTLTANATVTFKVQKRTVGRRVRGRCVKTTSRNRTRKRCFRYTRVRGSFTRTGTAGTNKFKFTGRIGGRKLRPGAYRLVGSVAGTAPKRITFKIVRR